MLDRVRFTVCASAAAGLALTLSAQGAPVVPGSLPGLKNVHLLAVDIEFFGPVGFDAWRVNDSPSGKLSGVDLDAANDIADGGGYYAIAAINANGEVSVMLPEGDVVAGVTAWSDLFQTDAQTVKQWLLDSDLGALQDWFAFEIYDAGLATRFGKRGPLVAFDAQEPEASAIVNIGSVPPPSALVALGLGGLALARRRR